MTPFETRALDGATWSDFARLVEVNGGVWGGCWCMWHHGEARADAPAAEKRAAKECRVREGRAHAALVYDADACVGWCRFGPPGELPRLHNRRAYDEDAGAPPDWRIACVFVGKGHRGRGVAEAAIAGALDLIARAGGGRVEAYPKRTEGRKVAAGLLFNGALSTFERLGFARTRPIGKHRWVVTRTL